MLLSMMWCGIQVQTKRINPVLSSVGVVDVIVSNEIEHHMFAAVETLFGCVACSSISVFMHKYIDG